MPEDNGDFPDADYGLAGIPVELLDQATEVLFFLESIDWKWDIKTLLAQPSDLFEAVLKLLVAGRKQKKQNEKQAHHE